MTDRQAKACNTSGSHTYGLLVPGETRSAQCKSPATGVHFSSDLIICASPPIFLDQIHFVSQSHWDLNMALRTRVPDRKAEIAPQTGPVLAKGPALMVASLPATLVWQCQKSISSLQCTETPLLKLKFGWFFFTYYVCALFPILKTKSLLTWVDQLF